MRTKMMTFVRDSELLKALAHPVRLQMVCGLLTHNCNVNEIVERLGLPQSTVSQHLGILRSRGIISPEKQGVRTCYKVIDARAQRIAEVLRG